MGGLALEFASTASPLISKRLTRLTIGIFVTNAGHGFSCARVCRGNINLKVIPESEEQGVAG